MSVVLPGAEHLFRVHNYNLRETLTSGQAFRWAIGPEESWESVVRGHWVRLIRTEQGIAAQAAEPISDWNWLSHYLQTEVDLVAILRTFPVDGPMQSAVAACAGLRLLRQDPWECLASFILSSTKQIVQIQQIVALVCERFGAPVAVPSGHKREFAFPTAERIAACTESELRACKMGFRAPYLLEAARRVKSGALDLESLSALPVAQARTALQSLPGVGRKIADCVLLFAYGFQEAFPIDVWVMKALRQLYFPRRTVSLNRLHRFAETHFGPYSGYAQQYLFHYTRTRDVPEV
ncbi:MAG: DNA glycosylase [Verrucomicrobiota bacterium]|jgi:N-glycosylase/DNA lyase